MKFYNSFNELAAAQGYGPLLSQMSVFNGSSTDNMGQQDGAKKVQIDKEIDVLRRKIRQIQHAPANTEEDCTRLDAEVEKLEKEIKSLETELMYLGQQGATAVDAALYPDPPTEKPIAKAKPPANSLHRPTVSKPKDDDDGSWMPPSTRNEEN